jgi:membrane-bound lytic murein transglycosylase D
MPPPHSRERDQPSDASALNVRLPDGSVLRFHRPFYIGRDLDCEVQIQDAHASRRHAQVTFVGGQWTIRDLRSSNGLFVEGERVEAASIGDGISVRLGQDGPSIDLGPGNRFAAPPPSPPLPPREAELEQATEDSMIAGYADRYLTGDVNEDVGGRTMMIRKAYQKIQQKQKRQTRWIISAVAVLALGAATYAVYAYRQLGDRQKEAAETFYRMKTLDVLISGIQEEMEAKGTPVSANMKAYEKEREEFEQHYNRVAEKAYGRRLSAKEHLILRITRLLGECEVTAPPEYLREVSHYIDRWKSTKRFEQALKRAQDGGYAPKIVTAFRARQLPVQYFYLAMQESDFIQTAVGTPTRFGYAKGMWQFIPATGREYGLKPGPYFGDGRVDPGDERFNWERATVAAASYIKKIYATDAQASGLLVMASYNWGERRVVERLRKMPANPRERNFWKLLKLYPQDIPPETYNYVFSIVSAAVIGENPRLFGFPFDNPLGFANSAQ